MGLSIKCMVEDICITNLFLLPWVLMGFYSYCLLQEKIRNKQNQQVYQQVYDHICCPQGFMDYIYKEFQGLQKSQRQKLIKLQMQTNFDNNSSGIDNKQLKSFNKMYY